MAETPNIDVDSDHSDLELPVDVREMNNRAIRCLRDVDPETVPREFTAQIADLNTILNDLRQLGVSHAPPEYRESEERPGQLATGVHAENTASVDQEQPQPAEQAEHPTRWDGSERSNWSFRMGIFGGADSSEHSDHPDVSGASTSEFRNNSSAAECSESVGADSSMGGESTGATSVNTYNFREKEICRTIKTIERMFRIIEKFNHRRYDKSFEMYERKINSGETNLDTLSQYMEYIIALAKSIDIHTDMEKKHNSILNTFAMVYDKMSERFGSDFEQHPERMELVEAVLDYMQNLKTELIKYPELQDAVYAEIPKE